jgi:hypothetical protein
MGLRFTQRIRLFKGLTLNLSKSGTSWTVGGPGASVNFRGRKVTGTVGVPGTGISYMQTLSGGEQQPAQPRVEQRYVPSARRGRWLLAGITVLVLLFLLVWLGSR